MRNIIRDINAAGAYSALSSSSPVSRNGLFTQYLDAEMSQVQGAAQTAAYSASSTGGWQSVAMRTTASGASYLDLSMEPVILDPEFEDGPVFVGG